jgi:dUTP pyrophosphatase
MALYIYSEDYNIKKLLNDLNLSRRTTDSGFDIPLLYQTVDTFNPFHTFHLGIKVGATDKDGNPTPCLLLPRSSISNSPFRMSNSIGLVDAGYRGNVQARTDVLAQSTEEHFIIKDGTRYFQLCKHDFLPWDKVVIVDNENDLPAPPDNRGDGGFGSTGK